MMQPVIRLVAVGFCLSTFACGSIDVNAGGFESTGSEEAIGTAEQPIWYGDSSAANLAVVELYRNGGSYCTGFFITRRKLSTRMRQRLRVFYDAKAGFSGLGLGWASCGGVFSAA